MYKICGRLFRMYDGDDLMEICHLYDREACNVTENECTKCQLEYLWNSTISLIINEIKITKVGGGAFTYFAKGSLNEARKKGVKAKIEKLKLIELQLENLEI